MQTGRVPSTGKSLAPVTGMTRSQQSGSTLCTTLKLSRQRDNSCTFSRGKSRRLRKLRYSRRSLKTRRNATDARKPKLHPRETKLSSPESHASRRGSNQLCRHCYHDERPRTPVRLHPIIPFGPGNIGACCPRVVQPEHNLPTRTQSHPHHHLRSARIGRLRAILLSMMRGSLQGRHHCAVHASRTRVRQARYTVLRR